MNGICDVTKVRVHNLLEEFVLVARQSDFLHLLGQMSQVSQIYTIVFNSK